MSKESFIKLILEEYNDNITEQELNEYYDKLESKVKGSIDGNEMIQSMKALPNLLNFTFNITKVNFLSLFMDAWEDFIDDKRKEIEKSMIKHSDENNYVITLEEFFIIIERLESSYNKEQIFHLFLEVYL